MSLAAGTLLGPYQVLGLIGAGGMGEVYKARDTRLDRTVAIKVLASNIAGDPDLRARFEREARAVAALDHPHICGIYEVGEASGTHFIVLPHLDGETLAARLEKGPLPLDQTLKIATEMADALDKAHRQGIVHRDVKPANIILTKTGSKLLDFGLAKVNPPVSSISSSGMTRLAASGPGTSYGMILGTVQYMAPEQIEGKGADARSDIWALGAVIYEMATGIRAFKGDTPASVISAILRDDPLPVSAHQPLASPLLDHILKRCLAKAPDDRWQTARDLMLELTSVDDMRAGSAILPPASARSRWPVLTSVALAGLACGGLAVWLLGRTAARAVVDAPVIEHAARMTHESGFTEWPTWSPDGKLFAFASDRSGTFEIYVRRVEAGQEVNVTNHPADDVQPAFSPDGTSIAFVSTRTSRTRLIKIGTFIGFDTRTYGGDVWVAPAFGGQARRVAEDGNFPLWHPNGHTLMYVSGEENHRSILTVSIDGGAPKPILPASASSWEITRLGYAPSKNWITFETADRQVLAMPAEGGRPSELFRGSSHVWDPLGRRIYYVNSESDGGTRVEAVEVRETATALTVVRTVTLGVSTGTLKELTIAGDRLHLLATGVEESLNLTRVPLTPDGGDVAGPEEPLSRGQVRDRYPTISPDGRRIVVGSNQIGQEELWIVDLSSRRWERVQMPNVDGAWVTQACWAKDNQHVAVIRFFQNGTSASWYVALDGSSAEQLFPPTPAVTGSFACEFSPDGRRLVYLHRANGFSQLFVMDMASRREQQLTKSPSDKYQASWSPDGHWLAFAGNTGGSVQVWRISASGGEEQQLTTGLDRNRHAFYSPDGHWLYVQPNHRNIYRMPNDGGPLRAVTHYPEESSLFLEEPTISPDGRWLAYNRGGGGSSLWMLTIANP
ncbi:MAG: protein kinase domain-containing protein [Acidobacteriota bacterium]